MSSSGSCASCGRSLDFRVDKLPALVMPQGIGLCIACQGLLGNRCLSRPLWRSANDSAQDDTGSMRRFRRRIIG
jgi:hypothetical protein